MTQEETRLWCDFMARFGARSGSGPDHPPGPCYCACVIGACVCEAQCDGSCLNAAEDRARQELAAKLAPAPGSCWNAAVNENDNINLPGRPPPGEQEQKQELMADYLKQGQELEQPERGPCNCESVLACVCDAQCDGSCLCVRTDQPEQSLEQPYDVPEQPEQNLEQPGQNLEYDPEMITMMSDYEVHCGEQEQDVVRLVQLRPPPSPSCIHVS